MMKSLPGLAAGAALLVSAAWAQAVPTLTEFRLACGRDSSTCRLKVRDFVNASVSQKTICLPKDTSINEATSQLQNWMRSDAAEPLKGEAYDDALYEGSNKLFPCAPPEQPPAPPAPPQAQ